jgi:hypothetical protein
MITSVVSHNKQNTQQMAIARVSSELLSPRIKIDILWNRDGRARQMAAEHASPYDSLHDVGKPGVPRQTHIRFQFDFRAVSHE